MSEYDLKKSEKVGQLYPVLVDAKGNVIDGFHRLEADPKWRTEEHPEINTEEKLLVARCVANWHRRQVSREEKEKWIAELARIYEKEGLKVRKSIKTSTGGYRVNEIVQKIAFVTGLSEDTVRDYIPRAYKQTEQIREVTPRVPASQVIEKALPDKDYGRKLVERHREEVLLEEKPKIEREVREELSRDAEFIREAIEKAPEVLPTIPEKTIERAKKAIKPLTKEMGVKEGTIYTVGEYECPYCKRHYLIKCNGKKDWVE